MVALWAQSSSGSQECGYKQNITIQHKLLGNHTEIKTGRIYKVPQNDFLSIESSSDNYLNAGFEGIGYTVVLPV